MIRGIKSMKRLVVIVTAALMTAAALAGCASTKGAVYGAGIGALAGDAQKGAQIGATVGTVYGILD